jgi:hypothetical protein
MTTEPRNESDYSQRQTIAARRVLVDVGQVLASFVDCLVVVGGCTPVAVTNWCIGFLGCCEQPRKSGFTAPHAEGPRQQD